ncbi:MAG: protein kinase [Polyangia bacterium]
MHPESTPTWLIGPEVAPSQRIGTVLSGSYRLDAFLGQGMTGVTYNAWHLRQKQPYAVKLLHRELAPSHERVAKLRHDLRELSGLRKFGFLPVELSFAPDGAPFLASELLIGETLRARLSRGPLPSLAAGIVAQALARALGEAHKAGIVHGDLRPENVLLPTEAGRDVDAGQPVLLDAALHHLRKRPIGLDESLPLSKLVYLAPEQASGEQQTADAAGDVFALGAILYESLTGQQAFAGPELEVILEKLAEPPKRLLLAREVGAPPGLAAALDQVIAKACARDPEERYQSMEEFLKGLASAYTDSGLPLPPPDERVSIDTVQAQNRALRKRTVAVKRVLPTAPLPDAEVVDPSKVLTAASMPLPGPDEIEGDADTTEVRPAQAQSLAAATKPESTVPMKRNTAKQRVLRPTRRARDLSKLVAEIEAGRLTPEQAMAMAQNGDDNSDSDEAYESTDEAPKVVAEQEQLIAEGRAAVLARAEEAKRNREQQLRERQAREKAEAQEMQRRLLDQARAETLGRMRAEWEQSRASKAAASESAKSHKSGGGAAEAVPNAVATKDLATQQSELLAEAQRQAQRLEEERIEAERRAAEEAERARQEAEAAETSRQEAARLEAERRAVEEKEAERAERMRQKSEREALARERAEAAAQERQAKLAEVEAAERAAQEAKRQAEEARQKAEEAKQAVETEEAMSAWEDGLELLVEDAQKKPPPPPPAALREKSEAARMAEDVARTAREQAEAAAEAAARAKEEAESTARAADEARKAKEAAEASRIREASEFAAIIAAAEEARAKEQALREQIFEAELRAKMAEQASVKEQARATRATQALVVIRQVENLARRDPISEEPTVPVMLDETTHPQKRNQPPAPSSVTPLVLSQTTQQVAPPEPSVSYAAFQVTQSMRPGDASGGYTTGQLNAGAIPDASGGYSSAQIAAAALRQATGMTGAQAVQAGAPMHPMSGGPSAPMGMMGSGPVPGMPHIQTGNLPILPGSGPVSMVQPVVVMPQRPADAGGFHFTTRSLVGTLGMTSVLSGVIGSLLTLLVLRSQQSGGPPPVPAPAETDTEARGERGQTRPTGPAVTPSVTPPVAPPSSVPTTSPGTSAPTSPTPPTSTPTPVMPIGTGGPRPGLRPPSVLLPPLRLASEQPTMPPRPSQWLLKNAARPAQGGAAAQPGAKTPGESSLEAPETPDSKPAPEAKPATETKPAAKPAGDVKPAAKPATDSKPAAKSSDGKPAPEDGLRNPFGK